MADDHLDVLADRSRALPVVDPDDRELTISCGAAVGAARVAMRYFGHTGQVELLPDPAEHDLLARISLGEPHTPTERDRALFEAIRWRRSTRQKFEDEPLPSELPQTLQDIAQDHDVELAIVTGDHQRSAVAETIAEADKEQYDDTDFRRELTQWINSKREAYDGMSLAAYGAPDLLSGAGALVIRTFDVGGGIAAQDRQVASGAPALLVVATGGEHETGS